MHCDATASVLQIYDAVEQLLRQAQLAHFLEPKEHVLAVERLRCEYRPGSEIRFLVLAESHVRVSPEQFLCRGPGFLYNAQYYTPWWRHLLIPAFAPYENNATRVVRKRLLEEFRSDGVWFLDASLISLSGYSKLNSGWNNRAFDSLRRDIVSLSWQGYVQNQLLSVLNQKKPPVVCALKSMVDLLPEAQRAGCTRLNFLSPSNSRQYGAADYAFGTEAFIRSVRAAGL